MSHIFQFETAPNSGKNSWSRIPFLTHHPPSQINDRSLSIIIQSVERTVHLHELIARAIIVSDFLFLAYVVECILIIHKYLILDDIKKWDLVKKYFTASWNTECALFFKIIESLFTRIRRKAEFDKNPYKSEHIFRSLRMGGGGGGGGGTLSAEM